MQSVLNASARLIFDLRRSDHITDALASLHWLLVSERIKYKTALLTFRGLRGEAPRYLSDGRSCRGRLSTSAATVFDDHSADSASSSEAVHFRLLHQFSGISHQLT
jgi:hypothetical protein